MKFLLSGIICLLTLQLYSQSTFQSEEAKKIVDTFFEGFHKGDTLLMKSVLEPKVTLQTAFTNREGNPIVVNEDATKLLIAIAQRPSDQVWDERLLDYTVQIDGNLAHVWTPYEFWFNGNFSHCGANAFTLAKTESGWKIVHLIDSRRKEGCSN